MNIRKRFCSAALASCLVLAIPMQSMAALSDYDGETAARLQDNKMEFDELQNLIKEYNPSIINARNELKSAENDKNAVVGGFQSDIEDLKSTLNDLKDQRKELKSSAKENHAENSPEYQFALAQLNAAIAQIEGGYDDKGNKVSGALDQLSKGSNSYRKNVDKGLEKGEKAMDTPIRQMTQATEGLMITYNSLIDTQATLNKSIELYEVLLESTKRQVSLGLGTETDILSAESDLMGMRSSADKVDQAVIQLRSQLCSLTGWAADANPEIGGIPAADVSKIAAMDLSSDTVKAIKNNQTLMGTRHASSGKTTAGVKNKALNVNEQEQKLTIEMQRLYNEVQAKKLAYDAGTAAFEKAKIAKNGADVQYRSGIISRVQYLATELQYVQAEGTWKAADNGLFQAILNYEWAVDGFAAIPD